MTNAAAVAGDFSDFRTVKGRKVCQLIIEIPIEQADAALDALGGIPRPDKSRPVAVARLHSPGPQAHAGNGASEGEASPGKERKRFRDLPASQRAALMCNDFAFQAWVGEQVKKPGQTEQDCADFLRARCGVYSRAKFDSDAAARARFEVLETQFLVETGRIGAPR